MSYLRPVNRSRPPGPSMPHGLWFAGAALLLALSRFSSLSITGAELIYACLFLTIGIHAYLSWARGAGAKIPIWPLVCGVHFVFYGMAIFLSTRLSPSRYDRGLNLPDEVLADSMLLGLVGLLSLGLGRTGGLRFARAHDIHLTLMETPSYTPLRVQILLLLGIAFNVLGTPFIDTAFRNVSVIAATTLPLAAFLWVVLAASVRRASPIDILLALRIPGDPHSRSREIRRVVGRGCRSGAARGLSRRRAEAAPSLGRDRDCRLSHSFSPTCQGKDSPRGGPRDDGGGGGFHEVG